MKRPDISKGDHEVGAGTYNPTMWDRPKSATVKIGTDHRKSLFDKKP